MDTIVIGQGYNFDKYDTSVGKTLIEQFESHRYTSFTCLVAFASFGGVSALTPKIIEAKKNGVKIRVILGVDQEGTSKEALEEVLSWNIDAKIYHTEDMNIFHPKVYLFENEDIFSLIVGSNNLTIPGLVQNVECALMIKDIKSNPVLGNFYDYWNGILQGTEQNLYILTQELIEKLYEDKIITLEADRSNRIIQSRVKSIKENKNIIFNSKGLQPLPDGFVPKRQQRKIAVKSVADSSKVDNAESERYVEIGSDVLIAEIGGGPRWKQINFPIDIFTNFFGASRGDNTYTIDLINIKKDGVWSEVEKRQAVTVKSNNFRFEIKCEETTRSYPGKEKRPIGIFIKLSDKVFLYQVLMPDYDIYAFIRGYLYDKDVCLKRAGELKRIIVDIEDLHTLYPTLIK